MESQSNIPPLIVIVGETASGKSALALRIAQQYKGEIIAADSRTLYKGMDIGTAKPSRSELSAVPHHLIDIATPDHPITARQFKDLATQAIHDIRSRDKIPLLVGGTGLYINAVVYDYVFAGRPDPVQRTYLEGLTVQELHQYLIDKGIPMPHNSYNKRHLVRQAETGGAPVQPHELIPNTYVLGLQPEREELHTNIAARVEAMFDAGLESEVSSLVDLYGWKTSVLQTIGYQEFKDYFEGGISHDELKNLIIRHTVQYAKRQRTWFKRNKDIHWICNTEDAIALITTILNK